MRKKKNTPCHVDYFYRPGLFWTDEQMAKYQAEFDDIASDCFLQVPQYQCLSGDRNELKRNVITIARDENGKALGFCSAVILEVEGYKNILHLGLTCVKKEARSLGLTHVLTSKLLMKYLFQTSLFKRIWITNVACVLSSLGNVALYFENVFPSPYGKSRPGKKHICIARAVDEQYRLPVAINDDAVLDLENFVFRGSVGNTVFQKSAKDSRYYHRNPELTEFYLNRLNFKNGDEVIQIARIGLLSMPKYYLKLIVLKFIKSTQVPIRRIKAALFR